MRYKIISDREGRIRVRFGGYAFDKSLENCIKRVAMDNKFVISAEAHCANGGLLIYYKKGHRKDVINFINLLNFRSLTPIPEDNATREIDDNFKKGLIKIGVNHFVKKVIIPAPLRPFFVIGKSVKYIMKGL